MSRNPIALAPGRPAENPAENPAVTAAVMLAVTLAAMLALTLAAPVAAAVNVDVDLSDYTPDCGVKVTRAGQRLAIGWPMADGQWGQVVLNLAGGGPLVEQLGVSVGVNGPAAVLLRNVDPAVFVTVGTRRVPPAKPADQAWAVFFDKPANRPHETFTARLDLTSARVSSRGRRATIALSEMSAGPFTGELRLTFYAGCRLVHVDAALTTKQDHLAIIYDAGLLGEDPGWRRIAWMDTDGRMQSAATAGDAGPADRAVKVRHRTIIAQGDSGAVACFPPPHQFQFPRDWTDNFGFNWFGKGHHGAARFGLGVRQDESGGRAFVPWFNAPPGVEHHMAMFLLLSTGDASEALRHTLKFTHGDRFLDLPGHLTFTSHWHMAVAVTAMQEQQRNPNRPLPVPQFVNMFKDMNVNMVHLGEFHGDGHQRDPGPLRLPEMQAMFAQCRRLSDERLLLIPGEEVNTFLGLPQPGKHPGHWMSLFPKPVYWTLQRAEGQPFATDDATYGKVYHVGDRDDMSRLLREQGGLAWTAHPRIKASSWTPDIFRREDFYLADFWLGAAWKALPADLSKERLGWRPLQLLSDMANWGQHKYMPGEVDVFKLEHTHELYAHMNINYLRLDHLPRYDEGWQPVLDALRHGAFFVTTGEVLIRDFTVGGQRSGQTLALTDDPTPELRIELQWTFPLRFAEVISGDGQREYRQRIDLSDTEAFGTRTLTLRPNLRGRTWVRVEVWDAAVNGAFTQPVWLQ